MRVRTAVPMAATGLLFSITLASAPALAQDAEDRPVPFGLGVGLGTLVNGSSVLAPNTASVRFVLSEEMQVEPLVNVSLTGQPDAAGDTSSTTTLRAGGLLRYVSMSNGPMDLQLLGGALLGYVAAEGGSTLDLTASYGLAVVWYGSERWSISGDATNPVFNMNRVSPDEGDSRTSYTLGVVWNPTVTAMVHFYM